MTKYNNDLVSIIIPCYNSESTLQRAYKSIKEQTYHNIEAIFIDDGSTDRTLEILSQIKEDYQRAIVIHQENSGVSAARNAGLAACNGEYITFLDADDELDKHFVEKMHNSISEAKCDVAYCYYTRDKQKLGKKVRTDKKACGLQDQKQVMRVLVKEKYRMGFTTFIFRHDLITEYSIAFPYGLKTGEDLEFLLSYLVKCNTGVEVNDYLYWYYNNPVSAVHNTSWSRTDSIKSLERIRKMMELNNCDFSVEFYDYMSARYLWSYAKNFSVARRKDLFNQLASEYPIKEKMRYLVSHCPDIRVRTTAGLYVISRYLFFYLIAIVGK